MIDIHSHLLPGVDDGSPSVEVSVPVLERFGADGVDVLVCTPHLMASAAAKAPSERNAGILAKLIEKAPGKPELKLGYEIMLDVPGADLRAPGLRLGGSNAVLVEFPRMNVPVGAAQELLRLRMSGLVPVLAHPERYLGCTLRSVQEWRDVGAVIQTDAGILLGTHGPSRLAKAMLERGLIDCLASDNHGDHRSLLPAARWLSEIGAEEQSRILTHTNAQRLLASQPLLPLSPIAPLERGMLRRLRELFVKRP
ncbi:MAG: tyrosine-protein phosphatase [Gemmatimonadaceae bacterium]